MISLFFCMKIENNPSDLTISEQNLKYRKNGDNITSQIQGVMRRLVFDANTLYGSNIHSNSIYLSTNLAKLYPGAWQVIIALTNDQAKNTGMVAMSQNGSWWGVWVGQNPSYPNWTYFFSKLPINSNYVFREIFNFDNNNITYGNDISDSQKQKVAQLIANTTNDTLFQKANQINLMVSTIIQRTSCSWNIFLVKRVNGGILYSGYLPIKTNSYIYGRHQIQNPSDSNYYYLITCV